MILRYISKRIGSIQHNEKKSIQCLILPKAVSQHVSSLCIGMLFFKYDVMVSTNHRVNNCQETFFVLTQLLHYLVPGIWFLVGGPAVVDKAASNVCEATVCHDILTPPPPPTHPPTPTHLPPPPSPHPPTPTPTPTPWTKWLPFRRRFFSFFVNEKFCILITISMKLVAKGATDNNPALVQIMAWLTWDQSFHSYIFNVVYTTFGQCQAWNDLWLFQVFLFCYIIVSGPIKHWVTNCQPRGFFYLQFFFQYGIKL